LFASQIHPLTQVKKLTISELKRLIFHIQEIMKLAIEYNGTTIATFDINYQKGQFQNFLKVYSRHNKKCLTCSEIIVRFEHNKRGTFYCKKCQPLST
jgi:formamidopyrimidine-DNA glycosylase